MSSDFLKRLAAGPILCDGAMGTLLYAKGFFINRCYDELNLSQPDLIRSVHQEYLQAGAEVIETNTFGANSFRLARHGFGDRVHDINLAGASLARQIVTRKETDQTFFVAGSVGPLFALSLWEKPRLRKPARPFAIRLPRWLRVVSMLFSSKHLPR